MMVELARKEQALESLSLGRLFRPRAVAVVGVSSDPGKLGSVVFNNLLASGYAGRIYAVGRSGSNFLGHTICPNITSIPDSLDVVFFAIPAAVTEAGLAEAGAAGVKFAIIGSSGFAESGDTSARAKIAEMVRETGMRIVGPNCNGIYNSDPPLSFGFNRAHGEHWPAGRVSIISHSGALFHPLARLLTAAGAGLASFISTGNEDDLDVLDYAEFLIEDANTSVAALLIDALSDEQRFAVIARRAQSLGKAIVVLKLGQTALGAATATAHSSRLTGSAEAYSALFDALDVPVVSTIEGLMTSAGALARFGLRQGRLGVITTSGAGGALIADASARHGVLLAELSEETKVDLGQHRQFSAVGNPVDLGIFGSDGCWPEVVHRVADDKDVGAILAYFHSFGGLRGRKLLEALSDAQTATGIPVLALCPGGLEPDEALEYSERGLMLLSDTDSALQAAAAMLRTPACAASIEVITDVSRSAVKLELSKTIYTEADSLSELARWGIPTVPFVICQTLDEVLAAARNFGWPVAMKLIVAGEAHKTEQGHVKLNLTDVSAVAEAFYALGPVEAVIVQPMVKGELEAIAGIAQTAAGSGPMLMLGTGGIHVEAIGDIAFCPLWAPRAFIETRFSSTILGGILRSNRWRYPESFELLIEVLLGLRDFGLAAGNDLEAVDINPLLIGAHGITAVDALIVPRNQGQSRNCTRIGKMS